MRKHLLRTLGLCLAAVLLAAFVMPVAGLGARTALAAGIEVGKESEIDLSQADLGLIKIKYTGSSSAKLKVQIIKDDTDKQTLDMQGGGISNTFTLTKGAGSYKIIVAKQIEGDKYAALQTVTVQFAAGGTSSGGSSSSSSSSAPAPTNASGGSSSTQKDLSQDPSFAPYLCSNSTVVYSSSSAVVSKAASLCSGKSTDAEKLTALYKFIVDNFSYDYDKADAIRAKRITNPYTPDVDATLSSKKGICYDIACMLAAMCRSQGIPAKLIKGYADLGYAQPIYHAWNEVYLQSVGWVKVGGGFNFDGKSYSGMDPTSSACDKKYVFKSSKYQNSSAY